MKRSILFFTVVVLSIQLSAQDKPVFGIKGGLNISDLTVENVDNAYDTRLGFHIGGMAHIHITPNIAFQPELQFSSQGAEFKNSNDELRLNFVNVPLMFQYMFNNGFRLEAGPQIGLLLNAEDKIGNVEIDRDEAFKNVDIGLGVGLNYLTYSGVGVGARYNLGVSNINEGSTNVMNRVFQLSVFYMFDSDHKSKSK